MMWATPSQGQVQRIGNPGSAEECRWQSCGVRTQSGC